MNWSETLKSIFTLTLLCSTIRVSISILLAGMGEMITERSGVLNIGVEGTMLMGALAAALGSYFSGSPWIGLLAAGIVGMLVGLLFSFIAITLRSNQSITGLAIYLLCVGLSGYLLQIIFGRDWWRLSLYFSNLSFLREHGCRTWFHRTFCGDFRECETRWRFPRLYVLWIHGCAAKNFADCNSRFHDTA
jgi:ABC-type uncharacterized transport system permease subunit